MVRVKAYFTRWRRGYLLLPLALLLLIYLSSGEAELLEVEISLPQVRTLVERIPASGKIKPVKEVRISPDVSGEVVEIGCREGEWVERGTLLIKIKQDIYLSAVERAEALLQAAEAERREQEANVERMEGRFRRDSLLFCNQALSQREYEESQWDYKIALEQLRGALYNIETCRAELKESRENLFKSTIYAPISGYVTKIYVELGERVVGTSQMAGTIMLCIADMGSMEVQVNLNENDIAKVCCGDSAEIRVDALQGRLFCGIVTSIGCTPVGEDYGYSGNSSAGGITEYPVKVAIVGERSDEEGPREEHKLQRGGNRPLTGMTASLLLMAGRSENALSVPLSAVTQREGRRVVFLYDSLSGVAVERPVLCGVQEGELIEITGGLSAGESVICAPYSTIRRELENMSSVLVKKE